MPDQPAPHGGDALATVRNVFIELTSRCNMGCVFCPYPVLERPRQDMPHELVMKVLEELEGQGKDVTFHVLGEPLLNRRFFEYARYCDGHGINYWLVTNGTLLKPEVCRQLFALQNLKNLEISFHTFTEESFRLRACAMHFGTWMERIKTALFSPERYAADIPCNLDVMYDLNLLNGNAWHAFSLERWEDFAGILQGWANDLLQAFPDARQRYPKYFTGRKKIFQRGDYYLYRRYEDIPQDFFASLPEHINWIRWEIFPQTFVTIKKFFFFGKSAAYLDNALPMAAHHVTGARNFQCGWLQDMTVLSDGTISLCCLDYEGELSPGNIADMTLAQAAASAHRQRVLADPGQFPFCSRCKGSLHIDSKGQTPTGGNQ